MPPAALQHLGLRAASGRTKTDFVMVCALPSPTGRPPPHPLCAVRMPSGPAVPCCAEGMCAVG